MPENTKNLIRSLRQQLGMTQEEFAHEIAVTVSTVNRWENSHAEPSKLAWKAIRELGGWILVRAKDNMLFTSAIAAIDQVLPVMDGES